MMKALLLIFVLATSLVVITAESTTPVHELFFHNVPTKYMPTVTSDYIGTKGDCVSGYRLRSKFVLTLPNPDNCEIIGFANPTIKVNSIEDAGPITTKTDTPVCDLATRVCTQVITTEVQSLQCDEDPFDHGDLHRGDLMMTLELAGTCNNLKRKFGVVGAKVEYQYTVDTLKRLSETQGIHQKRDVVTVSKRAPGGTVALGGSCMTSAECAGPTCERNCSAGVCVAVTDHAYCATLLSSAVGISPCLTALTCNTSAPEYHYGAIAAGTGCAGTYGSVGTACTFVTEPGDDYGQSTGVCQGGYEGYCASNNQLGFIGDQDETTKSSRIEDAFVGGSSSDVGQFNEGGFPLFIGTDATDPADRQKELPIAQSNLATEGWFHADDDDYKQLVGLVATYPIDHDLVDDDASNDQAARNALMNGNVNCNVTAHYDSYGNPLKYCSGQSYYTASPNINGTYIEPKFTDFIDDDDSHGEGGDRHHAKLKGNGTGFCTPVCYCKNITYKGEDKYQIVACTPGYFMVAGDHGNKISRNWSIWLLTIAAAVVVFYILVYHIRIIISEAGRMRIRRLIGKIEFKGK